MIKSHGKNYQYYFRVTTSPVAVMQRRDKNGHKKNDGFWLLCGIFNQYIKRNIIMALLRKPKRKTDSNFNFVQAAKLLIRFKDEGM